MAPVYAEEDLIKTVISTDPGREDYPQYALTNCSVRNRVDYKLTDVLNVNEFPLGLIIEGDMHPNDQTGTQCLTPYARAALKKDKRLTVLLKEVFTYAVETDPAAHTIKIWVLGKRGWFWIQQASGEYDEMLRICLMKAMVYDVFERLFVNSTKREFDSSKRTMSLAQWMRETVRCFPEFMALLEEEGGATFDAFVTVHAKWLWSKVLDAKDTSGSLLYIQRGEDMPLAQFFFEMDPWSHADAVKEIRDRDVRMVEAEKMEKGELQKVWYFNRQEVARKAKTMVDAFRTEMMKRQAVKDVALLNTASLTAETLQEFVADNWEWVDKRASKFVVYALSSEAVQYFSTDAVWRDSPLYRDLRCMQGREYPDGYFSLYLIPKTGAEPTLNPEIKAELQERNRLILMDCLGPGYESNADELFADSIMTGEDLAQFKHLTNRGITRKSGSYETFTACPSDVHSRIDTEGALDLLETPPPRKKKSQKVHLKKEPESASRKDKVFIKGESPAEVPMVKKRFPGLKKRVPAEGHESTKPVKQKSKTPKPAVQQKAQGTTSAPPKRGRPAGVGKDEHRRIKRKTEPTSFSDAEMMGYESEGPMIPSSEKTSAPPTSTDQSLQEYTPMTDDASYRKSKSKKGPAPPLPIKPPKLTSPQQPATPPRTPNRPPSPTQDTHPSCTPPGALPSPPPPSPPTPNPTTSPVPTSTPRSSAASSQPSRETLTTSTTPSSRACASLA
ncbi:hypothetical protein BJ508DRAFT_144510 [Ascobolus immersus RN42]|uniref:Uncharacterized protein n=1 Tax=Ascobolus immersus RN42 TaxID=1160509 RepID=A0A3N4I1B4_ASCIM|nr:hypothetical protein BJ508DRAFT_144510 [Ascobolus immersus RN42]